MDLVNLHRGQMERTTPELATFSPTFRTVPMGGGLIHVVGFNVHQDHMHCRSSVGWGTPPATNPRPCHWDTASRKFCIYKSDETSDNSITRPVVMLFRIRNEFHI
ncbi:hypothetical protein AVEN_97195-1 [Araneus ventricosus]|uniref:Uncharacterized protein n=1 Tax=Araneus ventricosus TaxID=182803 RepID=A0A4Y2DF67_ARAVE|nr:hypothetical protein AVEN_97195-1 [Araneus ventricosus]